MKIKIGINGMGRIGRMIVRSIIENNYSNIEIKHINNRTSPEICSNLLKYDSIHGKFEAEVKFDEKHLRQAFYQNLMPDIYMTVLNNNYRMDVLDILRLVSVYSPEHIKFDTTEKGNPSLSLENISKKNNITTNYEAGPHDAVYDSLITLELIKML